MSRDFEVPHYVPLSDEEIAADHAQKLKIMMEERWKSPQITNARRTARYTKPVGMGGKKGYDNDIFGE